MSLSRAPIQRAAHQFFVNSPRLLLALRPLSVWMGRALRIPVVVAVAVTVAAHAIASRRSVTISRTSWLESSVIQASSGPTTLWARAFFCSIISSILSSSVPTHTNLCTSTLRFWPMRKARSVA